MFCVITFEPIEVQTCSAPQNDCLILIFVKDIYTNSRKLARNGGKTAIYNFVSSQVQKKNICIFVITDSYVDGRKLTRNGRKTAILAGRWGRLPIDDEYAALII